MKTKLGPLSNRLKIEFHTHLCYNYLGTHIYYNQARLILAWVRPSQIPTPKFIRFHIFNYKIYKLYSIILFSYS